MNQRGFTLIEMMVVVSIGVVLVTMAIPNYLQWDANQKLKESMSELKGKLQVARIVALKTGTPVGINFTKDDKNTPDKSSDDEYSYFLFSDNNAGTSNGVYDNGEQLVDESGMLTDASTTTTRVQQSRELKRGVMLNDLSIIMFGTSGRRSLPSGVGPVSLSLSNGYNTTRTLTITPVGDIL